MTLRFNCPFCKGHNTLAITNLNELYVYQCFRASCKRTGKLLGKLTLAQANSMVANMFSNKPKQQEHGEVRETHWHYIHDNVKCLNWLKKYNCYEYYQDNPDSFMYDQKKDRLVFLATMDKGKCIDAIGRSLCGETPKWWRYGSSGLGFYARYLKAHLPFGELNPITNYMNTIVIVEDAASACSVARECSSLALLGTSLTEDQLLFLMKEPKADIVIMLDKDAISRAVEVGNTLKSFGFQVKVVYPDDDPKYLSADKIREYLCK